MKLKNFFLALAIVAMPSVLTSCGDDENEPKESETTVVLDPLTNSDGVLTYEINDNVAQTVTVTNAVKSSVNVVIPARVKINGTTYTVTKIAYHAMSECNSLESVTIPSTMQKIESDAFPYRDLTLYCLGKTSPFGQDGKGYVCFCYYYAPKRKWIKIYVPKGYKDNYSKSFDPEAMKGISSTLPLIGIYETE